MKKQCGFIPLLIVCLSLSSCGDQVNPVSLDNAPIVAERVMVNGEELIDLDLSLLSDTLTFPFSQFAEELEIIKLDDADDALVQSNHVVVSDNYIVTFPAGGVPAKLFTRQGEYIGNIGNLGQGPGEYAYLHWVRIDEQAGRIYMIAWRNTHIMMYDMTGKYLSDVPLARLTSKVAFHLLDNNQILVLSPPNQKEIENSIWVQDYAGNLLYDIPTGHLDIPFNGSNTLFSDNNTPGVINYYFWIWKTQQDSLYHVDLDKRKLIPRFTATFKGDRLKPHFYQEWPDYFLGSNSTIVTESWYDEEGNLQMRKVGDPPSYYIVDKKTLRGAYFKLENDYLGNELFDWPIAFNHGYYSSNVDPGVFAERLEKLLKKDNLTEAMRKKLTDLLNSISEDDNNYIMYAKMK